MLTVQHLSRPEGIVSDAKGQVPLQTSAEFVRTYNAQAHEIVDAITAAVVSAQAGLNWLRAEPPDLEEVRQVLNFIARDGKRAAEIVIRLQALIEEVPTADVALRTQRVVFPPASPQGLWDLSYWGDFRLKPPNLVVAE
jgi:hypothetical protein